MSVSRFTSASAVDRNGLVRANDAEAYLAGGTGLAAAVWRIDLASQRYDRATLRSMLGKERIMQSYLWQMGLKETNPSF